MKRLLVPLICFAISACTSEDIKEPSDFICTQVENSKIDVNQSGFRNVVLNDSGRIQTIGYLNQNQFVKHSACTAAHKEDNGVNRTYSWYEFGAPKEYKGVHSISYYTNRFGQPSSIATRLSKEGTWQKQYVENGQVTRQDWTNEAPYELILAYNNYDSNNERKVVVSTNGISKTKKYNFNTAQFDCEYNDSGFITVDLGCVNELANDVTIIGSTVDSNFYLNQLLNTKIDYELNFEQFDEDIAKYF